MLNVLTILTYTGCALGFISAIWNYFSIGMTNKIYESGTVTTKIGDKQFDKIISSVGELARKQYDNRLMILVFGLLGIGLCFYGAMQMRNLKKQGYLIYLAGELLPIISFTVFIGVGNIFGAIGMTFTVLISAVFIVLYTTQRSSLVN
jgi:hypothetical protein